jgi:hypothetical protein
MDPKNASENQAKYSTFAKTSPKYTGARKSDPRTLAVATVAGRLDEDEGTGRTWGDGEKRSSGGEARYRAGERVATSSAGQKRPLEP